jgi:hypothetical protein
VRGILYIKGGEGIMKEERLSSTSSWSVSSLPAGHVWMSESMKSLGCRVGPPQSQAISPVERDEHTHGREGGCVSL